VKVGGIGEGTKAKAGDKAFNKSSSAKSIGSNGVKSGVKSGDKKTKKKGDEKTDVIKADGHVMKAGDIISGQWEDGHWYPGTVLRVYLHEGPEEDDLRFPNAKRIHVRFHDQVIDVLAEDEVKSQAQLVQEAQTQKAADKAAKRELRKAATTEQAVQVVTSAKIGKLEKKKPKSKAEVFEFDDSSSSSSSDSSSETGSGDDGSKSDVSIGTTKSRPARPPALNSSTSSSARSSRSPPPMPDDDEGIVDLTEDAKVRTSKREVKVSASDKALVLQAAKVKRRLENPRHGPSIPRRAVTPVAEVKKYRKAVLVLGDGNLSFSRALVHLLKSKTSINPKEKWSDLASFDLVAATTLEDYRRLLKIYPLHVQTHNRVLLESTFAKVQHGVDAKFLRRTLKNDLVQLKYECIVFNYPLVGHTNEKVGRTSYMRDNIELIEAFFKNAHEVLAPGGTVRIALCNKQEAEFQLHESAERYLFYCEDTAILRDDSYPGYQRRRAMADNGWDCIFGETFIFKRAANDAELEVCKNASQLRPRFEREDEWNGYKRDELSQQNGHSGKTSNQSGRTFTSMIYPRDKLCHYFGSKNGCYQGENCQFRHELLPEKSETPAYSRDREEVDVASASEDKDEFSEPSPLTSEVDEDVIEIF
jgi:hypothetical protein